MRVTKYKTILTEDKKAKLEKEFSINYQAMDRKLNSPDRVIRLARDILRLHEQTEEYLYMVCMNIKLELTSVFELSHGNVNSSGLGLLREHGLVEGCGVLHGRSLYTLCKNK